MKEYFRIAKVRFPFCPLDVLVYQMGKVGSSTVYDTLLAAGIRAVQVHTLLPENVASIEKERGVRDRDYRYLKAIAHAVMRGRKRVRIITIVREPISQNFSAFFQNYERLKGRRLDASEWEALSVDDVISEYRDGYVNMGGTRFFDQEFFPVVGVDVYNFPFDHAKGYQIINKGRVSILIFRIDTPDPIKLSAINEFLGTSIADLVHSNVSGEKAYSRLYSEFKRRLSLPDSVVRGFVESTYSRHFFTSVELKGILDRWSETDLDRKL